MINKDGTLKNTMAKELMPDNREGLENYRFVSLYGTISVYHHTEYRSPLGKNTEGWLCCTEGWNKRDDGKWYETIQCGFKSRRVDTIEDIFDAYRENK